MKSLGGAHMARFALCAERIADIAKRRDICATLSLLNRVILAIRHLVIGHCAANRFDRLFQRESPLIQGLAHNRTLDSNLLQSAQRPQVVE